MTRRQVVLNKVDFPPILGPVRSITLESKLISLAMISDALRQGCLASLISNPSSVKIGLTPPD